MQLVQEFRVSLRVFVTHPTYSTAALAILALTIGANSAIFSIVHSVLLSPLPYLHSDRLFMVWEENAERGHRDGPSPPNFEDWKIRSRQFETLVAITSGSFVVRHADTPKLVPGMFVTPGFISTLGAPLILGRSFNEEDGHPGSQAVAIVSHRFWQSYLGGNSDPIGKQVETANWRLTVIGVLSSDFYYPDPVDLLVPLHFSESQLTESMRGARYLSVLGRLGEGALPNQAAAELESITKQSPNNRGWTVKLTRLHDHIVGDQKAQLILLAGAVLFLFLIACANVGGLALSRLAHRTEELAVRAALGATRFRLLAQVLVEMVMIFILGGLLGLVLASWSLDTLLALVPRELPRTQHIQVGLPVLLFTISISIISGLLFGVFPALRSTGSTRLGLSALNRRTLASSSLRSRRLLVITEIALSVVLLMASGLMLRSLLNLRSVDPGFDPANTVAISIALSSERYSSETERAQFLEQIIAKVSALEPISSVAAATNLPLSGSSMRFGFNIPGLPEETQQFSQYHAVTPDYFKTMRMRIISGRGFLLQDRPGSRPVAVVNQTLADRFWPDGQALGQVIQHASRSGLVRREIVGVVNDTGHSSLDSAAVPEIYVPFAEDPWHFFSVVAKLDSNNESAAQAIRESVWELDPNLPLDRLDSLDQWLVRSQAPLRFRTIVLGFFAGVALVLASVGIYGILSFLVTQNTREIGVHMALGASPSWVIQQVLGRGLKTVIIGILFGLAGSLAGARFLSNFLFEVKPLDLPTISGVIGLLFLSAALACYIPANRAVRIDPAEALRQE